MSSKSKTRANQKQRILEILGTGRKLTQAQAKNNYNILSLSSRVNELRRSGVAINSVPYRNKTGRTVVQYQMPQ